MYHRLGFLVIEPPQGFSQEQNLVIIGSSVSPKYLPPQGDAQEVIPPVEGAWIDDLSNQFIDDTGAEFQFGGPV